MTRDTKKTDAPRRTLSLKRETTPSIRIEERLHKVLAQAGLGSRRALEERIAGGQVKVNNEVAIVGSSTRPATASKLTPRFVASALNETRSRHIQQDGRRRHNARRPGRRPRPCSKAAAAQGARWIAAPLDINTPAAAAHDRRDLAKADASVDQVARAYICRTRKRLRAREELGSGVMRRRGNGQVRRDAPLRDRRRAAPATTGSAWCCMKAATAKCGACGKPWVSRSAA